MPTKPTKPVDWRILRRIALKAQPELRSAFLRAIAAVQDGTRIGTVRNLLLMGDVVGAADAIPWDHLAEPILRDQFVRTLRDVYETSGAKSAELLTRTRNVDGSPAFSLVDERPSRWVAEYGGKLIVQISEQTRGGIRESLQTMMDQGYSAQRAAQAIRPQIGLFDRWSKAVENYRLEMAASGMSAAQLDADVARYATQLRQARALMIARTESASAANQGAREALRQAVDGGFVQSEQIRRTWDASGEACPYCQAIADENEDGVGLDEPFRIPDEVSTGESTIDEPPAHPNCSCVTQVDVVRSDS